MFETLRKKNIVWPSRGHGNFSLLEILDAAGIVSDIWYCFLYVFFASLETRNTAHFFKIMLTAVNILLKSFVCLEENLQGEIYQSGNLKTRPT